MPSAKDSGGATALFIASQNGHLATVRFLLDHRAQVDLALHTNATPLYVSCQNGHLQVAEILLAFGAVPNSQTDDEATPLFIAAQMGHFGIVKKLLEFNGDIKLANRTKATPLFIAAQKPGFHSTFFDLLWWFWNFWQVMAWDVFASMLCKPPPHTFRQVWSVWSGFSTLHRGYFPGWVKWVSQSGWIWLDLTLNHSEEWSRWHRHVSTSCWFRHQRLHQWWCIPNLHCCAKRLHESAGIVDGSAGSWCQPQRQWWGNTDSDCSAEWTPRSCSLSIEEESGCHEGNEKRSNCTICCSTEWVPGGCPRPGCCQQILGKHVPAEWNKSTVCCSSEWPPWRCEIPATRRCRHQGEVMWRCITLLHCCTKRSFAHFDLPSGCRAQEPEVRAGTNVMTYRIIIQKYFMHVMMMIVRQ